MLKKLLDAVMNLAKPNYTQTGIAAGLANAPAFFAHMRQMRGRLSAGQVRGTNAIFRACAGSPLSYMSYKLATSWHETAYKMEPVTEIGGAAYFKRMYDIEGSRPEVARRLGNIHPGDGALFCGRGLPQITGRRNYRFATNRLRELGILRPHEDLEQTPELVLRPDIAGAILHYGMNEGWFTGKSLRTYLPASGPATFGQFVLARRIINGNDKAAKIAKEAEQFQSALIAGGYRA